MTNELGQSFLNCCINGGLTINDILQISNRANDSCVFIKDIRGVYLYVNNQFCNVIGKSSIVGLRDNDLYKNKCKVRSYQLFEECVLDTGNSLKVCEEMYVDYRNQPFLAHGNLYPLCSFGKRPDTVLGITSPEIILSGLKLEEIFKLNTDEIAAKLKKRSYHIKINDMDMNVSKRELQCLFEIIKGKHAGQIANALNIKQVSVESYINNLKMKLGVYTKSELIEIVFSQNLIEQIVL